MTLHADLPDIAFGTLGLVLFLLSIYYTIQLLEHLQRRDREALSAAFQRSRHAFFLFGAAFIPYSIGLLLELVFNQYVAYRPAVVGSAIAVIGHTYLLWILARETRKQSAGDAP